jgi:hypothetical protein
VIDGDVEQRARDLTDAELIERLRRAAAIWFKNSDLLLLEEFIKRFGRHGRWRVLP